MDTEVTEEEVTEEEVMEVTGEEGTEEEVTEVEEGTGVTEVTEEETDTAVTDKTLIPKIYFQRSHIYWQLRLLLVGCWLYSGPLLLSQPGVSSQLDIVYNCVKYMYMFIDIVIVRANI